MMMMFTSNGHDDESRFDAVHARRLALGSAEQRTQYNTMMKNDLDLLELIMCYARSPAMISSVSLTPAYLPMS
jgi:hypothetical protein